MNVAEKKKTQVNKANKKIPPEIISDQNDEALDSDSGVSVADGNNKSLIANAASSRKKKFSKTAKLVGQVEHREEFEDSVVTEDSGGKLQENSVATKGGLMKKRQNIQHEKRVNQVKLDSQEKPVNQVNGRDVKDEDRVIKKSSVVKENGGKKIVEKNVRVTNEEARSEEDDADEEEETCTEEDEQQCREENERRAERKQRTKLVKKVKVRMS